MVMSSRDITLEGLMVSAIMKEGGQFLSAARTESLDSGADLVSLLKAAAAFEKDSLLCFTNK